ncbi:methyltransferase [Roseobacter sp. SK209-2-6]|uniref:class I SAM-dependent methyltransferase n=1 Tax=Roseobacter sp. SK209-2-6 TaxID=388739 RepID=UPI0000F3EB93|nr:class I SAM-dependent methyltransferase [Roseobacter sp. SK209-2-6]EBA14275.1 methyltransferase [Roseobacter sp. SK209-2-6]
MQCRHCATPLSHNILDLAHAPPSNAYLEAEQRLQPEVHFPLRLFFCPSCTLVQTEDFCRADDLFDANYVYFSSTSSSWCAHAARSAESAIKRFDLDENSFVVEVASNDGYLLKNFVEAGIPCLGFEPTASTAEVARGKGVESRLEFFSEASARALRQERATQGKGQAGGADLIAGNNVYAHVPDINDFTRGLYQLLAPEGVISLEFPHLLELVRHGQFDTVYHEHFSYLSLTAVAKIFAAAGLRLFDVEVLPTHGGSLRIWGCRAEAAHRTEPAVRAILDEEAQAGITRPEFYHNLQHQADHAAEHLLAFLIECKSRGETVAAYGAAAKGTTLLNYARINPRLLPFVCDAAPFKQGRYLPGSHIPVRPVEALRETPPDHLLILPWNIKEEIAASLAWLAQDHGTAFWTVMPEPTRLEQPAFTQARSA